jgi:hypothetical protein
VNIGERLDMTLVPACSSLVSLQRISHWECGGAAAPGIVVSLRLWKRKENRKPVQGWNGGISTPRKGQWQKAWKTRTAEDSPYTVLATHH